MVAGKGLWKEIKEVSSMVLMMVLSLVNCVIAIAVLLETLSPWVFLLFYFCSIGLTVYLNYRLGYLYQMSHSFFAFCLLASVLFSGYVSWKTGNGTNFCLTLLGLVLVAFFAKIAVDKFHTKNKLI